MIKEEILFEYYRTRQYFRVGEGEYYYSFPISAWGTPGRIRVDLTDNKPKNSITLEGDMGLGIQFFFPSLRGRMELQLLPVWELTENATKEDFV